MIRSWVLTHKHKHWWWIKDRQDRQNRQCTYKRNIEELSSNIYCLGKAISVTCSKCVSVTFAIHNAMLINHTTLSSVACPDLPDFSTLSKKRNLFRKKKVLHIKCVLIFSKTFFCNISHCKKNSTTCCHKRVCIGLHVKYPLFSSNFNENWIF